MSDDIDQLVFAVGNRGMMASGRAVSFLDANPDDAAESLRLSQSTGIPAPVINGDLEGFQQRYKGELASSLIRNNSYIAEYVASNPLSAQVSNDDYANLDKASGSLGIIGRGRKILSAPTDALEAGFTEAWEGIKKGFGEGGLGSWLRDEDIRDYRFMSALASTVGAPVEVVLRSLMAAQHGAMGFGAGVARQGYLNVTGDEQSAKRLGRDIGGMVEMMTMPGAPHNIPVNPKVVEGIQASRQWLSEGLEPPRGIHPEIDGFKVERNKVELEQINEALKDSIASTTRERAPDMYAGFVRQHIGDAKIGISGDAIVALYGDKVPDINDGILGWVPDIGTQLEAARQTGQDIQIPLADWLAKVDPTIAKGLEPDTRVRPGNITANEAAQTKDMFYGSREPLTQFEDKPTFFTSDRNVADQYSKGNVLGKEAGSQATVHNVSVRPGNTFDLSKPEHQAIYEQIRQEYNKQAEPDARLPRLDSEGFLQNGIPGFGNAQVIMAEAAKRGFDSMRVAEGTQGESLLVQSPAKSVQLNASRFVDSPMANVRGASALEPMFSIGDRKLQLQKFGEPVKGYENFHDFQMVDENGQTVGVLNLSTQDGGKKIYVESIEGINGYGPRDFGPSLMRDILRQIKAEFPNATELVGHRVSGARDKVGKLAAAGIKLDNPEGWGVAETKVFQEAMNEAWIQQFSPNILAEVKPTELYTKHEAELNRIVQEELARIVPTAHTQGVTDIKMGDMSPRGAWVAYKDQSPIILYKLLDDGQKTIDVGRHEAIHHLRQYGFFNDAEWNILTQAAEANKWSEKFGIESRYNWAGPELKLEESIAEGFRDWMKQRDSLADRAKQLVGLESPIDKIFRKLAEFLDRIKARFAEILGKEPTWEQLFEKVDKGEIGAREGTKPLNPETYYEGKPKEGEIITPERQLVLDEVRESLADGYMDATTGERAVNVAISNVKDLIEQGETHAPNGAPWKDVLEELERRKTIKVEDARLMAEARADMLRANATGLDLTSFKRIQRLIEQRHAEDYAAAIKRAEREQKKRQSEEWKAKGAEIRPQVVEDIRSRPDVALDNLLASGELYGQKIGEAVRIRTEDLTPEQQALVPKQYQNKSGWPAQELADYFGYPTKDAMVQALAAYTEMRRASGKSADMFRRSLIDAEVERRLEREFGFLEKNIMEEAKDQALSETQLNILAEELHAAGMLAKVETIDANVAKTWAREKFSELKVGDIKSDHFLDQVGKNGRDAERALIAGKPADAIQFMQRKFLNAVMAKQARELEDAHAKLDRSVRKYLRKEVKGTDQAFTNHIQNLLMQAGYKVRLSPEDIQRSIEFHGQGTLPEFTQKVLADGWEPAVAKWIQDSGAKPIESMTSAEFYQFKDAIDSLNHIGREINKIELLGAKAEFAEWKKGVIENITQLPVRELTANGRGKWIYKIDAALTKSEMIVKDLDLRQEAGPLWDAVIRPMVLSKTKEFDLMSELADHFKKVQGDFGKEWRKSLDERIEQDFVWDPYYDRPMEFTRQNLINMMLNWGNRSNIEKLLNGLWFSATKQRATKEQLAAFEPEVKAFIDQHARSEDWQFVQAMWQPFKGWRPQMDTVARNTSGVAPKWIEPIEVATPHGNFEGGYWPVKYDRNRSRISEVKNEVGMDGVFGSAYFRAATAKGYLTERTGFVDFVDLTTSIEQAAGVMQQTIHDIAFRDALMQAQKVFSDRDIMSAIRKHYGPEYAAQFEPWLKRIAYQYSTADGLEGWNQLLKTARMHLVSHTLPFSANVLLSPDIGMPNPAAWTRYLSNRKDNLALAMEKSNELRHLVYNLDRDYTELLNRLSNRSGYNEFVRKAVEIGYYLPTKASQEFRASTFLDKYNEALAKGKTDTEAALIADTYVRERHGAASIVDLPAAMSSNEGMKMLTIFGGYFSTMYNWQRSMPESVRQGDWKNAAVAFTGTTLVGAGFGAALFNQQKEGDSWFKVIAKALALAPLQTVPVLNQGASYTFEGFAPRMPIASFMSATGEAVKDVVKAVKRQEVKKPITHGANVVGLATGLPLAQAGRTTQFLADAHVRNKQRPRNIVEYMRGLRTGEARLKP